MASFGDARIHPIRWGRVEIDANDCWRWTGATSTNGYGGIRSGGLHHQAHRFFYEKLVGPVPAGRELDHLCRVRCCVNPAHLEPVSHGENVRRGIVPQRTKERAAKRTHCKKGHALTPENLQGGANARRGWRGCRLCIVEHGRRKREADRAARPPRSGPRSRCGACGQPGHNRRTCSEVACHA